MDGVGLGMQRGRVAKEVASAVERGEAPFRASFGFLWKAGNEVFGGFAHDFGERPIMLLGDGFEPQIKWIRELNLRACHGVLFTSEADCRQSPGGRGLLQIKQVADCCFHFRVLRGGQFTHPPGEFVGIKAGESLDVDGGRFR